MWKSFAFKIYKCAKTHKHNFEITDEMTKFISERTTCDKKIFAINLHLRVGISHSAIGLFMNARNWPQQFKGQT